MYSAVRLALLCLLGLANAAINAIYTNLDYPNFLGSYTHFIVNFWNPGDAPNIPPSLVNFYHTNGRKVLVSAFGGGVNPDLSNPWGVASQLANFVWSTGIDGVDIDYEDSASCADPNGAGVNFLVQLTQALRYYLGNGYIITHAPQSPYFDPNGGFSNCYTQVHNQVGNLINFYLVQFYNQGSYTTCDGLLNGDSNIGLFQIASRNNIPLSKLVIGKPNSASEDGYMSRSSFQTCLQTAINRGWNAGIMAWNLNNDINEQGSKWSTIFSNLNWNTGTGTTGTGKIANWATCTAAGSCASPGWACCVAPADVLTGKRTCRYPPSTQCASTGVTNVANWATCQAGDSCANGWTCCVAPADIASGKLTCRSPPSSQCYNGNL